MREKLHGNEYWVTMVYVDSYDEGVLKGRFSNPYLEAPEEFSSLADFLTQSYAAPRTFRDAPVQLQSAPQPRVIAGKKATFALSVRFRQHSSWQGYVTWLDKGQKQNFRSVLELIFLVDSALREQAPLQMETISLA